MNCFAQKSENKTSEVGDRIRVQFPVRDIYLGINTLEALRLCAI